MKAPVKPFDIIDLAAMKLEEELKPTTPEELYNSIPVASPKINAKVTKATAKDDWKRKARLDGVYKVDHEFFDSLPTFQWHDIFAFSNKDPATGVKWSKKGTVEKVVGYSTSFAKTGQKTLES